MTFRRRGSTALPFASARFDYVVWIEGPRLRGDTLARLREVLRVLKPGGRLVFTDIVDPASPSGRRGGREPSVVDARQYESLLCSAGFTDVRVEDITPVSWVPLRERSALFLHAHCSPTEERAGLVARVSERLQKGASAGSRYVLGSAVKQAGDAGERGP